MSEDEAREAPPVADAADPTPEPAPEAAGTQADGGTGDLLFDTLWKRVEESWDDDKAHNAFLDYVIRNERLPDAAGAYRRVKERDPERATRAQKKLDGIVVAATHMLMAMKTEAVSGKVPSWVTLTAFGISMGLLTWLYYAMSHRPH